MKSYALPDNVRLNSISAERNMVLFIMMSVSFVLFFLSISNFVMSLTPYESDTHKFFALEHTHSETSAPYRFKFVTLIQGGH